MRSFTTPAPVAPGPSSDDEEQQREDEGEQEQQEAAGARSGSSGAGWHSEDASEEEREGDAGPHDPQQQQQAEQEEEEREGGESSVVCVTADYAMQNVILQMGLRLCAPDGMRITRTRRWALRCTACSQVSKVRCCYTPLSGPRWVPVHCCWLKLYSLSVTFLSRGICSGRPWAMRCCVFRRVAVIAGLSCRRRAGVPTVRFWASLP